MSSVDEARARELFLADIIRELSRQQQEDAASFSGARKSNCTAVFRKLCFDFPLVNDDDLAELLVSMTGLFQGSNDGIFRGNPFEEEFSLHEKFLENILFLCNSHSNEAEMAESVTHKSVSNSTKHQIAAVLFLVFPHYLLQCSDHRLMQLLGQDQLQRSWKDILLRFQSFIQLSTVSTIGCSTSNGIQQYLQDSECLSKLGDTIATLGVFTVQAERLLSDLEPLASASSSASSEEPSLTENSTTASASVEDPLDHLISMGMLSARTTSKDDRQVEGVKESATGAATGDRKKSVKSLKDMLQYVLVTATVYQSTQQSAASIKAVQVERLVGVLSVVKSCWLHLVFLYRDLLTQYPALIPSKAPVLFSALLSSPGGVGNGGGVSKMVAMKSDDFPSSAECMYVLVFCTLASHNAPSSASAPIGSSCTSTALASQIKTAFRTHLDTRSNLSEFVDLCVRMDKYASSGAKKNDTNVLRIDIEVQSFLIEVAMLYVDDLTRVTPRTGAGLQSNNAVSVLVASRLLPTLLFSAQALLAHEAKVANTGSHTVMPAGMAIFAARLCKVLTLLPVCSVPGSATSVLKYVLDFPDLLPSLSALAHKWQSCTASAAAVVDGATGDGDGESVGVRSLEVVSPVEVLGLSLTWLLSALQVQWTSPAGSSVAAGMGSAVVLDTLLTSFEVSVDQVRGEMNKVLLTLPDLFAAQQSRQSSTEENVAESAWEEAEERPEDLPGAFPAIDLLPGDVPEESGGSLDDIQRKIAAAMLSHDSDSDNEGAQKGSKNKNKKAGSSSTVAAEVPVVDVAAIESRKKRKHASHRYNAIVSFLSGLSEVLQILAGEGACAPILRRMCAVIALEKQKSVASMHVILQQQLTQFVRELMNKATELIQLIRSTTTENGSCEGAENTGTAKDKAAVGGGSSQLGSKVDVVKKQLKALQGLLQGGTSSKAD